MRIVKQLLTESDNGIFLYVEDWDSVVWLMLSF